MSVIAKWGNSLAIRIPKHIAEQLNLKEGTKIAIDVESQSIKISPRTMEYTLEELLAEAKSEDFEGESDWGEAVGEEVW